MQLGRRITTIHLPSSDGDSDRHRLQLCSTQITANVKRLNESVGKDANSREVACGASEITNATEGQLRGFNTLHKETVKAVERLKDVCLPAIGVVTSLAV